jgi:hypothetical protein
MTTVKASGDAVWVRVALFEGTSVKTIPGASNTVYRVSLLTFSVASLHYVTGD